MFAKTLANIDWSSVEDDTIVIDGVCIREDADRSIQAAIVNGIALTEDEINAVLSGSEKRVRTMYNGEQEEVAVVIYEKGGIPYFLEKKAVSIIESGLEDPDYIVPDSEEKSLLEVALCSGLEVIAEYLVAAGADIHRCGDCALWAVENNRELTVATLCSLENLGFDLSLIRPPLYEKTLLVAFVRNLRSTLMERDGFREEELNAFSIEQLIKIADSRAEKGLFCFDPFYQKYMILTKLGF